MALIHDAIVVGARCAGAATAMVLAGSGHRVLMVDQASFPSDIMSTCYIHQPGVARLSEWGILPALLETGCPRLTRLTHTIGPVAVSGRIPEYEGVDFAVAPRRHLLDQVLVDAAQAVGAEFRPRTKLIDLIHREGRVVGVRLRGHDGAVSEEYGRAVIGADGMRSAVARLSRAAQTVDDGRRTCVYYTGWRLGGDEVRIVESHHRSLSVIPTHHGVSLIATYAPQREFWRIRTDPLRFHLETIRELAPDLDDLLRNTEPVMRLTGTGDQRNYFREPAGRGWALVGDAGHHKDSITARGITDAFAQAELLGQSLAGRCGSDQAVDAALAEFARRRDASVAESYAATLTTTALELSARRLETHRRVSTSAALTEIYLAALAGIRPAGVSG
ncbi:NAD(P)/FAD-dependent oxidoreductase [Streptosporangium roseum]|uniref:NAD(P)/FAD-dependent oxidoreductase n=1 Tax=Streptosporangium roseum TaxID=2001 RepID=UPI003316A0CD